MKQTHVFAAALAAALIATVGAFAQEAAPTPVPAAPAAPPHKIPIEDFFRAPLIRLPLLNDAGNKLAAIFDANDHSGAIFYDLETGKTTTLQGTEKRDTDEVWWLDDEHALLKQTRRKLYSDGLYVTPVKYPRENYAILRHSGVQVVSVPRKNRMQPIVWIHSDAYHDGNDGGVHNLDGKLDIDPDVGNRPAGFAAVESLEQLTERNGTAAAIIDTYPASPGGLPNGFYPAFDGELGYAIFIKDGRRVLHFLDKKSWSPSPISVEKHTFIGAGDDRDEVLVSSAEEAGKPEAIVRMNVRTGEKIGVLYQDSQYDPVGSRVYRNPQTLKIAGLLYHRSKLENIWLAPELQGLEKQLQGFFPGMGTSVLGFDRTMNSLVVAVFADRQPVIYFLVDRAAGTYKRVAETRPWIQFASQATARKFNYKARDGLQIEAILTLPAGASKTSPVPLVVLPHGGPWARDEWEWNDEAQFFANRGYAVFQPNYRGSTGTQWQFTSGDSWDYRKMHNDVTDGVKKLKASGFIQKDRVAIVGTSFGGYLAIAGAAWEPELYCAAVTISGVSDWRNFMKEAKRERYDSGRYDFLLRNLGDPEIEQEKYDAISPILQVKNVKIPVLVAHGSDDRVVYISESKRLASALKNADVPTKTFFRSEEGHGMQTLENQVALYTEIEKFLAEAFSKPSAP